MNTQIRNGRKSWITTGPGMAWAIRRYSLGILASIPAGIAAGAVADVVPGAGVPAFLAVEAAAFYGLYKINRYNVDKKYDAQQAEVDKLK